MKIIPAIDILDGKVVRLYKGEYEKVTVYAEDPTTVMRDMIDKGADHIHIVNLSGAKNGTMMDIERILDYKTERDVTIQIGGGIRDYTTAENLIEAGVDELIISSMIFKNNKDYRKLKDKYPDNIILALDVMNDEIKINGWLEGTNCKLFDFLNSEDAIGVNKILVTDISKDGTLQGINSDLYKRLVSLSKIKVIVSGGVKDIEDINLSKELGAYGVIVGKSYYEGNIKEFGDI